MLLAWGAWGPLPGELQTVPRGELYIIIIVLERTVPHLSLTVVSDSQVNVKLYLKGPAATANAANHDLWVRLWAAKPAVRRPLSLGGPRGMLKRCTFCRGLLNRWTR